MMYRTNGEARVLKHSRKVGSSRAWRGKCALWLAVLLALPTAAWAAPEPPTDRPTGYNDSGAQLSRTRQYLEEQ